MHDVLAGIGDQVDEAVSECWRIAKRGHDLGQVLDDMAIARTREQLAAIPADETDPDVTEPGRLAAVARRQLRPRRRHQRRRRAAAAPPGGPPRGDVGARGRAVAHRRRRSGARRPRLRRVRDVVDELEALRLAFDELQPRAASSAPDSVDAAQLGAVALRCASRRCGTPSAISSGRAAPSRILAGTP